MWYIVSPGAVARSTLERLEMRLKEHQDACERGVVEKSVIAEQRWDNHHPIHWEETTGIVGEGGHAHPDDTRGGAL